MNISIAYLLTCHNRKNKTINCLHSLYKAIDLMTANVTNDVFLVDDGSTDNTSLEVKEKFKEVNIIQGSGNLFWNKGMSLAWNTAVNKKEYDFYIWLNDDVILKKESLLTLLETYKEGREKFKKEVLVVGSFKSSKTNEYSYGGRNDNGNVIPNGEIQECLYINGNMVLVSKPLYEKIGGLSMDYTHALGDYDYGLRVSKANYKNIITKKYIGVCEPNGQPKWSSSKVPLKKRLELFYSPYGLNYREYMIFRKKYWKTYQVFLFSIKAYLKVLFPSLYSKLKKHE